MSTPNYSFPYVTNGGAGGEVTHNKALNMLDAIVDCSVVGFGTNAPPGSPNNGEAWLIGASPSGAWVANANDIAIWNDGWTYVETKEHMFVFDIAGDVLKRLDDKGTNTWVEYGGQASSVTPLTDSTGGSATGTVGAAGGTYSQSFLNDSLASILAKQAEIIAALQSANLMA